MNIEVRQIFLAASGASCVFAIFHAILLIGVFTDIPILLINGAHLISSISLFFIAGGLFALLIKAKIITGLPAGVVLIFTGIVSLIGYNYCAIPLVVFLIWAGWLIASIWTGLSFYGSRQQIEFTSYITAILFIIWGFVRVWAEMMAVQASQLGLTQSSLTFLSIWFSLAIVVFGITGYYFRLCWYSYP